MPSTILSDNGVTSGTSGIKTTGSNDGTLALQTTTAGGAATTALTIDTSQNVGIGVAVPTAKLHITQTAASNALLVEDSANPDSTPFVIDATGNVVSGSTTAVNYGGFTPNIQVNAAGSAQIGLSRFSANTAQNAFTFLKSRGATVGDFTVVASGDSLGQVAWYGADGATGIQAAQITAAVDGTPGTNDMPGRLVFSTTADGASTVSERMRIDSIGNVGIGASTANYQKFGLGGTYPVSANISEVVSARGDFPAASSGTDTFLSRPTTSGAVSTLRHFRANPGTFTGAVTNQFGFVVDSSLTGATNNYGFYGNIASGTGRYNLYMNGTADNYFAGNVGIAVTAPEYRLDVTATDNVTTTTAVSVQNSARNYGLGLGAYTLTNRNIGGTATNIDYTFDIGGAAIFKTADTERMRIPSTGGIQSVNCISVGNATPSTSGAGVTFPATQSASSDANTLDDYEEGTWTPVAGGSSSTSGQSYSQQVGRYTKIGNQVTLTFRISLSNKGTMTGTYAQIQGFPFSTGSNSQTSGPINPYNNMNTGFTFLGFYCDPSSNFAYLTGSTGANANTSFLAPADINSSTQLIGSMTYFV